MKPRKFSFISGENNIRVWFHHWLGWLEIFGAWVDKIIAKDLAPAVVIYKLFHILRQ